MPFPETQRVIYKKNPLKKVICQLRYPPILKIESEPPYLFQEAIRKDFPQYIEKVELQHEQALGVRGQHTPDIINQFTTSAIKNHEFISNDGNWRINLTRTFLSISTDNYYKWEEFIQNFKEPLNSFEEIYKPSYFTRIGLRYVDVFDRDELGLKDTPWSELLKPNILGLLSSEISENINNLQNVYEIILDDSESFLRLITTFVENNHNNKCIMIDSDFYNTTKTKNEEIFNKLEFLHANSYRLIQWIIENKLHKAMNPEEL